MGTSFSGSVGVTFVLPQFMIGFTMDSLHEDSDSVRQRAAFWLVSNPEPEYLQLVDCDPDWIRSWFWDSRPGPGSTHTLAGFKS